jgi:hypothetical protein
MEYIKIYNQIIERAKTRQLEGYKEKHHTIPKCMGGLDNKENLVELTAREHFLCHHLLCKIYPENEKLWYALFLMAINKNKKIKYIISAREYSYIKEKWNLYSKNKPKPDGFGDKIRSKERNEKIGKANSKSKPEGFGEAHSIKMKGKPKPKGFGEKVIKNKSKSILQYDLNNNLIREWSNAVQASKELKINKSQINAAARENTAYKTAGSYIWKYKS